jgi:hypothetical protein
MRVAFVPRSAEIQPSIWRFVTFIPPFQIKPPGSIQLLSLLNLYDSSHKILIKASFIRGVESNRLLGKIRGKSGTLFLPEKS